MSSRRGIALVLVAGILLLLAGFSVAMLGLAGRLRIETSAGTDHASARLLARSGIEYASARLGNDSSRPDSPTPGNQPNDWTCRDERDVPVEKALNPSYAQTEPYADAPTGNGRYDAGADFFTDVNANGRFDSWSGRLRGRYGMTSGTFHLKIGGTGGSQGGSGGINVNSGIMEPLAFNPDGSPNWDIDGGGTLDFRDLQKFPWGLGPYYHPFNPFARNVRIAYAISQLGRLLGIAPPLPDAAAAVAPVLPLLSISPDDLKNNPSGYVTVKAGKTAAQAQSSPLPWVPGIGDRIISNRPLGGYRSLDEVGKLFSPADWLRLRDHLTVLSRRNPCAVHRSCSPSSNLYSTVEEPDAGYAVDVNAASPEVLAALFSGMGENTLGGLVDYRCEITPPEAMLAAGFLKRHPYVSGYELFQALQRAKGSLFLPVCGDPGYAQYDLASPGFTQILKAAWVHALAMPDEPGVRTITTRGWDLHCRSFSTYDLPHEPFDPPHKTPSQGPDYHSADWSVRAPKGAYYEMGQSYLGIENRDQTASGSAFVLGFGPVPSRFAVESAGKVSDGKGGLRALRLSSASILNEGEIEARTQQEIENVRFDPVRGRSSSVNRFDGGAVAGRPERDRVSTYPFFSLDACPGLAQSPLTQQTGFYPAPDSYSSSPYGRPYAWAYCCYGGEVMAASHSWVDPEAVFYRPCWDLAQPERPGLSKIELGRGESNFDDVMRGAKWQRSTQAIDSNLLFGDCLKAPQQGRATPTFASLYSCQFIWNPVSQQQQADNRCNFPLLSEKGAVEQGTMEAWYSYGFLYPGAVPYGNENIVQSNPMEVKAWFSEWIQQWSLWSDPAAPTQGVGLRHVAYAFDAGPGRVCAYMDGIWHGAANYVPRPVDTGRNQTLQTLNSVFPNEIRLYPTPLEAAAIQVHALRGRFWTAEPGEPDPSFTSAKYAFDGLVELTRIAWDGFVPDVLRDAVGAAYGSEADRDKVPIRVDLLLYRGTDPEPVRIELPRAAWRTGGASIDFMTVWRRDHPDPDDKPPKISALKYQVWLDVSALERAWNSPVFDGIEIGYKGRGGYSGLREQ